MVRRPTLRYILGGNEATEDSAWNPGRASKACSVMLSRNRSALVPDRTSGSTGTNADILSAWLAW
jgi:hypothetical protein